MRRGRLVLAAVVAGLVVAPAASATSPDPSAVRPTTTPIATTGMPTQTGAGGPTVGQTTIGQTTVAQTTTAIQTVTAPAQTETVTTTALASTSATKTAPAHRQTKPKVHHAAPPTVSGWLSSAVSPPQRAMVLQTPGHAAVTTGVTVSENGRPITGTVTSMSHPGRDDLAVTFALDTNTSMRGEGLTSAMGAIRAVAAAKTSTTTLGLVGFSSQPSLLLTPTAGAATVMQSLKYNPATGDGADLSSASDAFAGLLNQSGAIVRVAVIISDGVGVTPLTSTERTTLANAHIQVVTVGLQDAAATAASLAALKREDPGPYVQATPTEIAGTVQSTLASLQASTLVASWHSHVTGVAVDVQGQLAGAHGNVQGSYQAPPAPHTSSAPATRHKPATHPAHHGSPATSTLRGASPLSPAPDFTSPAVTAAPTAASGGFWHTGAARLLTAVLIALLVGSIVMLVLRRPIREGVRERVGEYSPTLEEDADGGFVIESDRRGLGGTLSRGSFWPPFVEAVEISRNPKSPGYLMKRALVISLFAGILFAFVTRFPFLFIVPVLASPFAERWWVFRAAQKQRDAFRDTLPGYMQDMASAIRVGRSFVGALAIVADSADEPTRSEFERAVTDESLGRPLDESLQAVGTRMQSLEMDQLALIAELNRRSGSNVAEALDRVADGARDRADLLREMRALTAQAKMSSSVLSGMPVVLLVALSFIAPSYSHPLFHTTYGFVAIGFAAVLVLSGWKVMKKISDVGA